jgi:hypothetical protein
MITIPLYIFLFLFFGVVAITAIFFGLIVYHLASGASLTLSSFVVTFFVFATIASTLFGVWYLLGDISWGTEVFQITLPTFFGSGSTPDLFVE